MNYLLLIFAGVSGWWIFKALNAPTPGLIGPMLFVGFINIIGFEFPELPKLSISIFQLVLGVFIGMKINRDEFKILKNGKVLYSAVLILLWTIGSSLLSANILITVTHLDVQTALLSGTPGGLSEMSVAAFSYGANVPTVALLQLLRLTFIILIIPFLSMMIKKKNGESSVKKGTIEMLKQQVQHKPICPEVILGGLILGSLFIYIGVPAGGLLGAIIGVGICNVVLKKCAYLPRQIQLAAQIGIGTSVGLRFTYETLTYFKELIVPMIILPLFMVLSGILLSFVISRMTKWDLSTCLLCAAPAGLSQMIIVAEDMECDVFKVSFFQTLRLLTIYLILPQIFNWYLI